MISTVVPSTPAWPRVMPHSAINVGIASAYICVSIASRPQPEKQAQYVRFSGFDSSLYQLNMLFP
ncbi:MAG TPA: hypothetical protein VNE00_27830 [Paraburkholderia sp.]|nr:hypothetical protein [Paraburkholderia sp.]